jgi:hypothetical protein
MIKETDIERKTELCESMYDCAGRVVEPVGNKESNSLHTHEPRRAKVTVINTEG